MSAGTVEVVNAGALSTIQDLGRFGLAHLGISPAGAADALSLRIANRLVGNEENAAAIEMTLVGATLRFEQACTIALAGADISNSAVPMFEAVRVAAGFVLECGPLQDGARTYLAVRGGFAVTEVLGSASTHLAGGFGGFGGRALKSGDVLNIANRCAESRSVPPLRLRELSRAHKEIRVTAGPQRTTFPADALQQFCSAEYVVTEQSNRLGLRLSGPAMNAVSPKEMLTEGVSLGAIQIPPGGEPIILFVDQQTTGGYPKLANVIAADLHCVGQLRPRDRIRFREVSIPEAIEALREQERCLAEAFSE